MIWLLKLLLLDLDTPNPFQSKDPQTRKKLLALQSRFHGALQFLKKTTVSRNGKVIHLNQLPWVLVLGPRNAGKTALLAHSGVHFILQRRFSNTDTQAIPASENCDWWITRDTTLIDVPGKYLTGEESSDARPPKTEASLSLWRLFLRLTKKLHGKHGVSAIIIALPLPEMLKESDSKRTQASMQTLFQRLLELQKMFPQSLRCQLVITKCDLLPGFAEFFAESANDEIVQAWGVALSAPTHHESLQEIVTERFNALIKKINQQLLWRLHQERNPMARPYIKDFPLQVERVKEGILDFIKQAQAAQIALSLQGVYLTSALQASTEEETSLLDDNLNHTQRALQLFKAPVPTSRAYFIKQFINHGLAYAQIQPTALSTQYAWKRGAVIGVSLTIIAGVAVILGQDFKQGINQTYVIQDHLTGYQLAVQQINDPDEHLLKTIKLMNDLQQSVKDAGITLDADHLISFYSKKSEQNAVTVYNQALRNILLPEMQTYLADYLKNPVNKNTEYVYAVLKAYLMLGDATHFESKFITDTLREILPRAMSKADTTALMQHAQLALNNVWRPAALDTTLVQNTRRYFSSMPPFQLAYIILKNMNNNNSESEINLGIKDKSQSVFISPQPITHMPTLFTAKAFANTLTQDTVIAAQEALNGNWVLNEGQSANTNSPLTAGLVDQLRIAYVNNYVAAWENLLANIRLSDTKDLAETDNLIVQLINRESPLLQLLQTLHDNTYFEPITTTSPKLLNLGMLVEKDGQSHQLYQIFSSLQALHQYLQSVITADNEIKAAFDIVSVRMQNHGTPDAITLLRVVAEKNPDPLKSWLNKLSNDAWRFLMQDASRYIDISWQRDVVHFYQLDIVNRYPFGANTNAEVPIDKFVSFFGNPGIVLNFYNTYLQSFVDASASDWRWKTLDDNKLPFSDDTLHQIQQAMRIHHTFFPNGDNKMYVQFALQPYQFGKYVNSVKLNINDKQFIDDKNGAKSPHVVAWPSDEKQKMTSVQFTLANRQIINHHFPGTWGWFKLVNQSFESVITKREMLINLSMDEHPVKYLLFTDTQFNPFISLNLRRFSLPQQLTEKKA